MTARNTNVGDFAGENTLVELANLGEVWVDLRAIGTDAQRLAPGQPVTVRSATSGIEAEAKISALLPLASTAARAWSARQPAQPGRQMAPRHDGLGRGHPGLRASAARGQVNPACSDSATSPWCSRKSATTDEVRMLELGRRDGQYAEVLGGLKPGTNYVAEQSYLIRADIEKSGASHDH